MGPLVVGENKNRMLKPHKRNKGFEAISCYHKGASICIKSRLRSEALIKVHRESSRRLRDATREPHCRSRRTCSFCRRTAISKRSLRKQRSMLRYSRLKSSHQESGLLWAWDVLEIDDWFSTELWNDDKWPQKEIIHPNSAIQRYLPLSGIMIDTRF